jgi:hypothetical protein
MNVIARRALVRCSRADAVDALSCLYGGRDAAGHEGLQLLVKAPVRLCGLGAEIELRHRTAVWLTATSDPNDGNVLDVVWRPAPDETFPAFTGRLSVLADTASTCWLKLDGTYATSPATLRLADLGERAIAGRIVLATASMLLESVARSIEPQPVL